MRARQKDAAWGWASASAGVGTASAAQAHGLAWGFPEGVCFEKWDPSRIGLWKKKKTNAASANFYFGKQLFPIKDVICVKTQQFITVSSLV